MNILEALNKSGKTKDEMIDELYLQVKLEQKKAYCREQLVLKELEKLRKKVATQDKYINFLEDRL